MRSNHKGYNMYVYIYTSYCIYVGMRFIGMCYYLLIGDITAVTTAFQIIMKFGIHSTTCCFVWNATHGDFIYNFLVAI